jgi:hypothetical protein
VTRAAIGVGAAAGPLLYGGDHESLARNLDHREMIALAEVFEHWALEDATRTPESRTELLLWACELERLAEWVGPGWHAPEPSAPPTLLKTLARKVLHSGAANMQPDRLFRWAEWRW